MFHKAEFNFVKYDNTSHWMKCEIKRWLIIEINPTKIFRMDGSPLHSSAVIPKEGSLFREHFHCPQLWWKEGPLYRLWSQALGHGGIDYPEQMKPSLRGRDSWVAESKMVLSHGGIPLLMEGRSGPFCLTSLTVLCPKSGHPFSNLTILKSHIMLWVLSHSVMSDFLQFHG